MNLLPTDCFHILIGLASGVSCTLIIGKSRIFAPLCGKVALWGETADGRLRTAAERNSPSVNSDVPLASAAVCRLLSAVLNCQQCLGFWVGLFTGLVLFGLL
jgi:hypothetical protein